MGSMANTFGDMAQAMAKARAICDERRENGRDLSKTMDGIPLYTGDAQRVVNPRGDGVQRVRDRQIRLMRFWLFHKMGHCYRAWRHGTKRLLRHKASNIADSLMGQNVCYRVPAG